MFGYNRLRADALAKSRAWFDDQLKISDTDRKNFIEENNLLPVTWAYKWSAAIPSAKEDNLFQRDSYKGKFKNKVVTTNTNITQQTDIISQETLALIDLEIRLQRLDKLKKGKTSVPTQHFDIVKQQKWIDLEIKKLIKERDKIDEKLTNSNKKLIEQRQKVLIGFMKKDKVLTPVERRDFLHGYLQDQMKELELEFNQLRPVKAALFRAAFKQINIDSSLNGHRALGVRQSLAQLKTLLTNINKTAPSPLSPIFKNITKNVEECSKALDKSLAKELKENTSLLKYVENQIRKPPKVKSSEEAVLQATQHTKAMIAVLEKRTHLLSGDAYIENQKSLVMWRGVLEAIRKSDAQTQKQSIVTPFVFEKPKLSLNRKQYVTNLDAAYEGVKAGIFYSASKTDLDNIKRIFSTLKNNILHPVNKMELPDKFERGLSINDWRTNINLGLNKVNLDAKDPLIGSLNQIFNDYLADKRKLRVTQVENPKASTEEVDDQAKICYAIYYAVTAKDVASRDDLLRKLQDRLESARHNLSTEAGTEKLDKLVRFVASSISYNSGPLPPKPVSTPSRPRSASMTSAAPSGLFGAKLPPPFVPSVSNENKKENNAQTKTAENNGKDFRKK